MCVSQWQVIQHTDKLFASYFRDCWSTGRNPYFQAINYALNNLDTSDEHFFEVINDVTTKSFPSSLKVAQWLFE